jgi:hypothetical protein
MTGVKAAALGVILAAVIAGCGSDPPRPTVNVSVGQQLIDLKKARDSGALSPREFEDQKAALIRNVD